MRRLIEARAAAAWAFAALGMLALVVSLVASIATQAATTKRIALEGAKRRNETCRLFERQELTNVTRVIRTYDYLDNLPRSEWGTVLTVAVVRGIPAQREDAMATVAPSYCNEPKGQPVVGLPESSKYQLELPPARDYRQLLKTP